MRLVPILIALLLIAPAAGALQDPEPEKAPVPDAAELKQKEKLVREIFKDEYAKTSAADKMALARKLLSQGIETADDPPCRFVLFRQARELATETGDVDTALNAIDEKDKSFQIDAVALKLAALSAMSRGAKDLDLCRRLASAYLQVAEDAFGRDDYDSASRAASSASSLARKSKELSLSAKAEARLKEYADIKARSEAVRPAQEKLAADPDDPAANLIVGKFLCLIRGDWQRGLAFLAKGSDAVLKWLADKELSAPTEAPSQMALGDDWWDAAEKETGTARENLRRHAAEWYNRCLDGLSGINRTKVEKRLKELDSKPAGPPGTWVECSDPQWFGMPGKPGDPLELVSDRDKMHGQALGKFPEGEFDGISARIRVRAEDCLTAVLGFEDENRCLVGIDPKKSAFLAFVREGGPNWNQKKEAPCPRKDEYVVTVLVQDGKYVCMLDGKVMFSFEATMDRFTFFCLMVDGGKATFDRARLRRKK